MFTSTLRKTFIFLTLLLPNTVFGAFVFTAPPRENTEKGYAVYKPIAEFLTKATGEHFIYKHQNTWPDYVGGMRNDQYDLVFDGPHFVDWRIHNMDHSIIIKIPHLLQWRVIARADDNTINKLEDLVGKKTCAPGSPNFGMLNLFSHFKNSEKQPVHIQVKGWNNVFDAVKDGTCVAGVLPKKNHQIYDRDGSFTKAIHTHLPYPNQAFTASKRIPESLREKIRTALLSEEGQQALINLRKRYTGGSKLVSAVDEEYDSIHSLLIEAESFSYRPAHEKYQPTYQLVNN